MTISPLPRNPRNEVSERVEILQRGGVRARRGKKALSLHGFMAFDIFAKPVGAPCHKIEAVKFLFAFSLAS
jgi:hypothetical protein